jgi:aminomethyltransferase
MLKLTSLVARTRRPLATAGVRQFSAPPSEQSLLKTTLYDFHVKNGAKMVPFAGYLMPVLYSDLSITQSHLHTRESASIFDVSHMLQSEIRGKDRIAFIESLVTGDIGLLKSGTGTLTLFTNKNGGIIDDLIVSTTTQDHLYVVSNAGCRDKDIPLLRNAEKEFKSRGKDVTFTTRDDLQLLAVQGPKAAAAVQALVPKSVDLSQLYFMQNIVTSVAGIENCRVTRCGYTGEDGVEISIPNQSVLHVTQALLDSKAASVKLAGLGARDSLRLEAGLCLYGNDMDEKTTPVEAGLSWLLGKTRKERKDFPGAEIILEQIKDKSKVLKRRIGLVSKSGPPPRSHMAIVDANSKKIGEVTSGVPSPSLGYNVAMAYVDSSAAGNASLNIQIRNTTVKADVVKMPFLKGKYHVPPKK